MIYYEEKTFKIMFEEVIKKIIGRMTTDEIRKALFVNKESEK